MNKKTKSEGSPWALAVIGVIVLIRALSSGRRGAIAPAIMIFAVAAILAVAKMAGKKKAEAAVRSLDQRGASTASRPTPTVQTSRPVPSMQRREPVTAKREYAKPEAYCVSCELSGEDHFVRDRQRRIAQLDDWLKNGLIDREEYQVLKRRFQNDQ